jgi:hypothetical protein
MRADELHAQHTREPRPAEPSIIVRILRRYPALCTLALMLAGLGVLVRALAWILSHDGCSHPIGAVVAVLALTVGGMLAFTPLLVLAASSAEWMFPEDSERE